MAACLQPDEGTYVSCIQLAVTCLQELECPVVTDESMFNQLDMVLKLLPEYAEERRASCEPVASMMPSLMGPLILPPIALSHRNLYVWRRTLRAPASVSFTGHTGAGLRVREGPPAHGPRPRGRSREQ